jgi:23S rRNA pseudouridine1911/1915/1917 synthase
MAVRRDGRPATTRYRTLAGRGAVSLLELELVTGRTHQIRVHLRHVGHPLIGDPVYGEARWKSLSGSIRKVLETFPRPALHAWRLELPHPTSGDRLAIEAPVPEDLRELWLAATGEALPERVRLGGSARPVRRAAPSR